jgi:hypothetical protein
MFSKSSQYISIIRYYNQLKFDYKLLVNDDIVKTEQSSFVVNDNIISQDVLYKLKVLEQNEPQTFIATLCDTVDQKLMLKSELVNEESYAVVGLNSEYNVALDKSMLFETKHFFEASGIDYIYSPFHILNLHCEQNPSASTLNGLILNNSLYIVILNETNQIVYYGIEGLTSFEEIQKSNFYDNEIFGQKLFDEIYYFEIENIISSVLEKFYATKEKVFIDKVTILHMIKQLNDEQINRLHKELYIHVNYHPISVDDYMYELAKQPKKIQKSFVKPRKKEKSKFVLTTLIVLSLLITFSAFYFYSYMSVKKEDIKEEILLEKDKAAQELERQKQKALNPTLPNHVLKNSIVQQRVLRLFELIPYSVVLDELELDTTDSKMKVTLLEDDIYIKEMQPKLLQQYKFSSIQFEELQSTSALKAVISNSELMPVSIKQENLPIYSKNGFLSKQEVESHVASALGEDVMFVFQSDFQSDITTFNYEVIMTHKEPKEFFALIERLNKEKYSINISYPIFMKKIDNMIHTSFILQFNQNH